MIRAVLFDLDGTLLGVDMDDFLRRYLVRLSQYFSELVDPQEFIETLLVSTRAMIMNTDPGLTNREAFMADFFTRLKVEPDIIMPMLDDFYENVFPELGKYVESYPETPKIIATSLAAGYSLVLATNPVFPQRAIRHRMSWAGLQADQFSLVTTYENMHFCKPHKEYYREIAELIGIDPELCLMVGNDADDDMAAGKIGMKTLLVEDFVVNKSGREPVVDFRCSLAELESFLIRLKGQAG